ncbi:hypothetical protein L1987_56973 [Smallanthus sonchifolius]|uniref:Uncharacterized protein n=1 Tax=Smallanthus sonchifolius TaxID=185202 RepID=A0ACB9DB95_9ASTR|nr:hypothetical protein L1987_56973 [Smallanthus sonchifolius]
MEVMGCGGTHLPTILINKRDGCTLLSQKELAFVESFFSVGLVIWRKGFLQMGIKIQTRVLVIFVIFGIIWDYQDEGEHNMGEAVAGVAPPVEHREEIYDPLATPDIDKVWVKVRKSLCKVAVLTDIIPVLDRYR